MVHADPAVFQGIMLILLPIDAWSVLLRVRSVHQELFAQHVLHLTT